MCGSVRGSRTARRHGTRAADTIVDRLGGDIRVTDADLGGAEFVVTLPAADPRPDEPRDDPFAQT